MAYANRFLTIPDRVEVGGRQIKRYHINYEDAEIGAAMQDPAYALLPRLLPEPDETPPASFSVLHRSPMGSYLLVYSWINTNVIELHAAVAGVPDLGAPDEDLTNFAVSTRHWIGCVWELAPLEHERSAWVRHMLQPEVPDLAGYLADQHAPGPIGSPTTMTEILG